MKTLQCLFFMRVLQLLTLLLSGFFGISVEISVFLCVHLLFHSKIEKNKKVEDTKKQTMFICFNLSLENSQTYTRTEKKEMQKK